MSVCVCVCHPRVCVCVCVIRTRACVCANTQNACKPSCLGCDHQQGQPLQHSAILTHQETRKDKDQIIAQKDKEIIEQEQKMVEMADEFEEMLKDTLEKMSERIENTVQSTMTEPPGKGAAAQGDSSTPPPVEGGAPAPA